MEGLLRPCWTACLNSLRALREPFATTYALCFPESLNWF